MNDDQKKFLREYLKHNDAELAYKNAYPNATAESCRTSSARMLKQQEVKAMVDKANADAKAELEAELKDAAKERQRKQQATEEDKRHTLALMVRGEWKVKRHIKLKDKLVEVYDDASPFAVLRAIELDTKLETGWFTQKQRAAMAKQEKQSLYAPGGFRVIIGDKAMDDKDGHKTMEWAWQQANPDKVQMEVIAQGEGMQQLRTHYVETPPWQTDPEWYSKQPKPAETTTSHSVTERSGLVTPTEQASNSVTFCNNSTPQTQAGKAPENTHSKTTDTSFDTKPPAPAPRKPLPEIDFWTVYTQVNAENMATMDEQLITYLRRGFYKKTREDKVDIIESFAGGAELLRRLGYKK